MTFADNIKNYLSKMTGKAVETGRAEMPASLPLLFRDRWKCVSAEFCGVPCVIAIAKSRERYSPIAVRKQLSRLAETMERPVVFAAESIGPHDHERLMAAGQPFVVPDKFMYLPFVGLAANSRKRDFFVDREVVSVTSELIVIGFLEHAFPPELFIADIAERLGVSKPSVQNGFRELEFFGLCERRRRNGARMFSFEFKNVGRELWETAQDILPDPIARTVGLTEPPQGAVLAGVDALAAMSDLAERSATEFAMRRSDFLAMRVPQVPRVNAPCRLQLWNYQPTIFGADRIDALSLALSLRGNNDDRVQIEIDKLMETFKW